VLKGFFVLQGQRGQFKNTPIQKVVVDDILFVENQF